MATAVKVTSGTNVRNMLGAAGVTTTTTGGWVEKASPYSAFQATVVGTGTVTGTVIIECSNDGVYAVNTALATITLSGTTSFSDGFTTSAPWKFVRARVTGISGTGAVITANVCE